MDRRTQNYSEHRTMRTEFIIILLTVIDGFGIFRGYILICQICTELKRETELETGLNWLYQHVSSIMLNITLKSSILVGHFGIEIKLTSTCCEISESNWPIDPDLLGTLWSRVIQNLDFSVLPVLLYWLFRFIPQLRDVDCQ